MPYMLLIMEPPGQRQGRSEDEGRQLYERMLRFGEDLKARGLLIASESLRGDEQGVRVKVRDGKATFVDGPFSESKEMVGGFFLLACESKREAVAVASQCPAAEWATVEVRGFGTCYEREG